MKRDFGVRRVVVIERGEEARKAVGEDIPVTGGFMAL